jgi:hypothetical protein
MTLASRLQRLYSQQNNGAPMSLAIETQYQIEARRFNRTAPA